MDSLTEDSEYVMRMAGVEGKLHYGAHTASTNFDRLKQYYSGLRQSEIIEFYNLYKKDFQMFGFGIRKYLLKWFWDILVKDY